MKLIQHLWHTKKGSDHVKSNIVTNTHLSSGIPPEKGPKFAASPCVLAQQGEGDLMLVRRDLGGCSRQITRQKIGTVSVWS